MNRRDALPRLQEQGAGLYSLGHILIGRTRSGWRVILADGDTFARSASFLCAVRAARHAARWNVADLYHYRQRA